MWPGKHFFLLKWDPLINLSLRPWKRSYFFFTLTCLKCLFFVGLPHLATYIFFYKLDARIDPGMALNVDHFHLVLWIRRDSNTRPLDRDFSSLTTIPDFCPNPIVVYRAVSKRFLWMCVENEWQVFLSFHAKFELEKSQLFKLNDCLEDGGQLIVTWNVFVLCGGLLFPHMSGRFHSDWIKNAADSSRTDGRYHEFQQQQE